MEDPRKTNPSPRAPAADARPTGAPAPPPASQRAPAEAHCPPPPLCPAPLPGSPRSSADPSPNEAGGDGAVSSFLEKALSVEFRAAMAESLQMPLEVQLREIQECSLADFLGSVEERSCCMALVARPDGAAAKAAEEAASAANAAAVEPGPPAGDSPPAWLEVSPQIAFPIIDRMLGGSGREWYVPNRAMTAIERRLLHRVAQAAAAGLGRAYPAPPPSPAPAGAGADASASAGAIAGAGAGAGASAGASGPAAPRWEWSVVAAQMPGEATPGPVVLAKFTLSMGRQAGAIRLCLPQELVGRLFPADEKWGQKWGQAPFSQQRKRSQSPHSQSPSSQSPSSSGQSPAISSAGPLELSVVVQDIAVSSEELAGIAEGDVLMTDTAEGGEVLVRIGGIPRFYARLGVSNGRKAIQITRRVE
jgi:flagellar motor switch protein FliM